MSDQDVVSGGHYDHSQVFRQKLFAALHMYVASFASQLFSSMIGSFLLDSPKGTDDCLYFNFVHQAIVR